MGKIFFNVMLNLWTKTMEVPGPGGSGAARGQTYKQARSWAQYVDSSRAPKYRWYPDLPLYRMGK